MPNTGEERTMEIDDMWDDEEDRVRCGPETTDTQAKGVRGALCNIGLCTGGIVCQDGKATCSGCGFIHSYSKANAELEEAYAELRKQRLVTKTVFDQEVWARVRKEEDDYLTD